MADTTIIQHRRGQYVNFDPQKMKPAELAVVQGGDPISSDGKGVYVAIQAGDVKRLATMDDMTDEINSVTDDIVEQVHEAADEILESVPQIQQNTSDIAELKADLSAEETARQNADTALQTAINAKANLTALAAEATERASADDALGEDITALSEDVETNYARIDGYYDSLGVGMADQLASNQYTEDNEPYVYRTSGGSADIGDREYDEIVGGTVAWNQLSSFGDGTISNNGITFTKENGIVTANGTASSMSFASSIVIPTFIAGHVYYFRGCPSGGSRTTYMIDTGAGLNSDFGSGVLTKFNGNTGNYYFRIYVFEGYVANNIVFKPQLFDLTQMFGTAVADAIYALEQAEAGAGVAWFKKLFPKDYYAYNAGELVSVSALQSHDMIGFNQWDEEWEVGGISNNTGGNWETNDRIRSKNFIPVFPNTVYYIKASSTIATLALYDADKNFISALTSISANYTRRMPANACYIRFNMPASYGLTYKNDICINFSWSGWRNGEYEAYDKHSYPLDSSLTLRGIPKVDSAGNMYYDGDVYSPDGTVTRRYGVVDLGTLEYTRTNSGLFRSYDIFNCKKGDLSSVLGNIIAQGYVTMSSGPITGPNGTEPSPNMVCALANGTSNIYFNNTSYTDAASFKAAMSGVYLVYELAEPTTETATPYASPQIVDDFGTEEYVSTADVRIPVGHNTKYMANLRDKLVHLPNLADSDGNYLIQQDGHTMELVKFRIPKAPTTDGTYTLKATVSGGTPTYTWVSDETEGGNEV